MFLVELGNDHAKQEGPRGGGPAQSAELARFLAQRVARWGATGRRGHPQLPPEALQALSQRRLGLIRGATPPR